MFGYSGEASEEAPYFTPSKTYCGIWDKKKEEALPPPTIHEYFNVAETSIVNLQLCVQLIFLGYGFSWHLFP